MASKRDYTAMAARVRILNDKIAESGALVTESILASVRELAEGIADMYAAGNPRFDRGRFMAACGFNTGSAPAPGRFRAPVPDGTPGPARLSRDLAAIAANRRLTRRGLRG